MKTTVTYQNVGMVSMRARKKIGFEKPVLL